MLDHAKALEEAKKMDPVVIEVIRQQVMAALVQGKSFDQFMQEVAYEQRRK